MKKTVFTGSAVAIVTPFTKDNKVNYDKLGELIDFQIANFTDAIVVCGTTGEVSVMPDDEHLEVIKYAIERTGKRVPVIAGTGSNDTMHGLELSKESEKLGADALLHVTPYYNKTTQKGLIEHFEYIADNVNIPIILYNVPSRTGMNISISSYEQLAKHPNIVATKEASENISQIAEIAAVCKDNLDIYSGNDDQILPVLSLGGKGVISVFSNIMPKQTHDICKLFFDGELEKSRNLQFEMLDLINKLFIEVNPIPVKEAMNMMGFDVGELRKPLTSMSKSNYEILKETLKKYNLI